MSLSAAVDNLLHRRYRKQDTQFELAELRDSYLDRIGKSKAEMDHWSIRYWDLINAVNEFLNDRSELNAEIMLKANLDAYPYKREWKAADFNGYMTV